METSHSILMQSHTVSTNGFRISKIKTVLIQCTNISAPREPLIGVELVCFQNRQSSQELFSNTYELSDLWMCHASPQLEIWPLRWTGFVHGARRNTVILSFTVLFALISNKPYWFMYFRSLF